MPKQVDHERRRAEIADAVLAVVARGGIEAASVRHVAAEAGVSVGLVQHYFPTKDELLRVAMERVAAGVQRRMGSGPAAPRDLLRAMFLQLLPLDEERAREGRVVLAFLAHALVQPAAGGTLRADARALRDHLAGLGGTDPALVTALIAVVDGLGIQVLTDQLDAADAIAAFDAVLDRVYMTPG